MRKSFSIALLVSSGLLQADLAPGMPACCYFAAKGKDINQPGQKVFLTWDPEAKVESFTVQPQFEGNAKEFGMVIPTPSKPSLEQMPREFFTELAVFTILEPTDWSRYREVQHIAMAPPSAVGTFVFRPTPVREIERGMVGFLEYRVIVADQATELYTWLRDNRYNYSGDEATLDFYIKRKWFFTVMKIDPTQMKQKVDGYYAGEVAPIRFRFASDRLIYPLRIVQNCVKDRIEALFYVQAPHKMDLPGDFSYECTWVPVWIQGTSWVIPGKLSKEEADWQDHVKPKVAAYLKQAENLVINSGFEPATLEWARQITQSDLDVIEGKKPYNRAAPRPAVENLRLLRAHLKQGSFVTKIRKIFTKDELGADLEFVRARVAGKDDNIEYASILSIWPR